MTLLYFNYCNYCSSYMNRPTVITDEVTRLLYIIIPEVTRFLLAHCDYWNNNITTFKYVIGLVFGNYILHVLHLLT